MNCTKCNTPYPAYELHYGMCLDCFYNYVVNLRAMVRLLKENLSCDCSPGHMCCNCELAKEAKDLLSDDL
jgi:hypothetical protein